jgi:transcriptional regulator with XRE-family HTH domain
MAPETFHYRKNRVPVTKTIVDGLKPYSLGEKLRALRLKKSMGLVELSKHTGLSAAMLSKLERDKLVPTLPTLLRIALVFSVGLDYFFIDPKKRRVLAIVRKAERLRFPEREGPTSTYTFESLDFKATERKLNAYYAEFEITTADKVKPHQHTGIEFLFVSRGRLEINIGNEPFVLEEGDSIYFDSGIRHSYLRVGKQPCSALIVTVP